MSMIEVIVRGNAKRSERLLFLIEFDGEIRGGWTSVRGAEGVSETAMLIQLQK